MSNSLPRITVIVPSYNQAAYLEACLESIVSQAYPNLELIVMDGGSNDGSVEIIERFDDHIDYWQSQPDGGQTNAIVMGVERSTGELLTWLNSDDIFLPGALRSQAQLYLRNPEADVFYGHHVVIDHDGRVVEKFRCPKFYPQLAWRTGPYICQPGTLFTRRGWDKADGMDTDMHCAFDYDFWYRLMKAQALFIRNPTFLSGFRRHELTKGETWLHQYEQEHRILREKYHIEFGTAMQRRAARLMLKALQSVNGHYISSLSYRLRVHKRLLRYRP